MKNILINYKDKCKIILDSDCEVLKIECTLPVLGEGNNRIVYDLGDKALKVAKSSKGSFYNRNEYNLWEYLKNKSEKIKNCIYKLKREYSDERNKAAFLHLKKELFIILKRICPRRLKLTMVYSTGSPDTTGISLGILACFPVGYTNRWRITPDFESEKPYAKGSFDIKGHVIVISILAATLRILFDKNCRRLYNRISR